MTTNTITPKVINNDISEDTPYNFNVPVADEVEIIVEFVDGDGNDLLPDTIYTISTAKSSGSDLFDNNTIEVTWDGAGSLPATNKLTVYRKTRDIQQTAFMLGADLSEETENEVDRLTRSQQDIYSRLDDIDNELENIEDNINPVIGTSELEDNSVTTPKIVDGAVTTSKIATASVDNTKLGSSSVTAVKIAANAVTTTKIVNDAVTNDKLANDSVGTDELIDDSVTSDKLAADSVTSDSLAQDVLDRFDQNIPFKLSVSTYSPKRIRIESSEVALNNLSKIAISNGKSILTFVGIEIDLVTGNTYTLTNVLISSGAFTFVAPSTNQFRTYLIEASFGPVNSLGKTPLVLNIVGGQQNITLGNQSYPELSPDRDLILGYVTVQESGGSIADLEESKLTTIKSSSFGSEGNVSRIRVASHPFNVGDKFIPVYWDGAKWDKADGSDINTLATHLIIDVLSDTEYSLAYSGRIFYPDHGLTAGTFYFLGEDAGVLSLVEADDFSNPILQVEDANYFTILGWRANEKSTTTDVTSVERINIPSLVSSTPTTFESALEDIYSISVYNSVRKKLPLSEIEIRIDDVTPKRFTLFSTKNWADLRVDLVGVK